MAKLQMQDTLTKLEQMCNQYDPTITSRVKAPVLEHVDCAD